jgi:hypothetical protein
VFSKNNLIIDIGKTKAMFCHSNKFGLLNKPQIVFNNTLIAYKPKENLKCNIPIRFMYKGE